MGVPTPRGRPHGAVPWGDAFPTPAPAGMFAVTAARVEEMFFQAKEKKIQNKKGLPVYLALTVSSRTSVAVLFCRRRDTYPEEERRRRWESFKKLWFKFVPPR